MDQAVHTPVDTTKAQPSKSILKKRHSHECDSHHSGCTAGSEEGGRRAQWDEMNILATYHPADKDYGHMKIDDPPTPYHEHNQELDDEKMDESDGSIRERKASFSDTRVEVLLDPDALTQKLNETDTTERIRKVSASSDNESEDDANLTEEQRAKKKEFEQKRKKHYNEFQVSVS